jgi:pyruvate/2-oxoglutarate/acetoin dehydrogenase E1 component
MPDNIGEYRLQLGVPEVISEGTDLTLITYGSTVKIAAEATRQLKLHGISVELIDVQTLVPFDREMMIVESIKKTNRVLFVDEDVPGGTTAFMMQELLERQGGWNYLDSPPKTLTGKEHRPAYTTDGDYFSKPSAEDIFDAVIAMMQEAGQDKSFLSEDIS